MPLEPGPAYNPQDESRPSLLGGRQWRNFTRSKLSTKVAWVVLIIMALVAIFGDIIANERPLYAEIDGTVYFPAFKSVGVKMGITGWPEGIRDREWKQKTYEKVFFPPIPWSPGTFDRNLPGTVPPLTRSQDASLPHMHWLGTDTARRDVAAGMIEGLRIAFTIGILSMAIAGFLGILLGSLAGYYGNWGILLSRGKWIAFISGSLIVLYILFAIPQEVTQGMEWWRWTLVLLATLLALGAGALMEKIPGLSGEHSFPMDFLVLRMIEILNSLPALLILLSLPVLIRGSNEVVIALIIGLLSWPAIARFARSEIMKIRSLEYIQSARAIGFGEGYILLRHALPNAIRPIMIMLAFGLAGSVLLEAYLSFLGIGLPDQQVSWGSMLSSARNDYTAWWLAIFPGTGIFITVLLFNVLGENLAKRKE